MKVLVQTSLLTCDHGSGVVTIGALQSMVHVNGVAVMVKGDFEAKPIGGCANAGPSIKPCTTTTAVTKGYSSHVFINNIPVALDDLEGVTDGTPPSTIPFKVRSASQVLVDMES